MPPNSLRNSYAGQKALRLSRHYTSIKAAGFCAQTYLSSPNVAEETFLCRTRDNLGSLRQHRAATRKTSPQKRSYQPESLPKNYLSYPSVQRLLRERGIPPETANIPATGPNGCLLKGDVLAYLGQVKQDYLAEQSQRLDTLSRLNLGGFNSKSTKSVPESDDSQVNVTSGTRSTSEFGHADVEVTTSISLDAVHQFQDLLRQSLDVNIPLSRFIIRASKIASEETLTQILSNAKEDEIFDAIVDHKQARPKPKFVPSITSLSAAMKPKLKESEVDCLDFLTEKWPARRNPNRAERNASNIAAKERSIFSVKVNNDNRSSAGMFLKKLKELLEVEPGQLII